MSGLSTLEDILLSNSIHLTFGAIRRYLSPYLTALRLVESQVVGDIHEIQISLGPGPFVGVIFMLLIFLLSFFIIVSLIQLVADPLILPFCLKVLN